MSYFLRGLAKGLDDVGTAKLKAKMEADKKNAANLLKAEAAKEKRKQDMEDFKAKEKIKNDYILKKEERQQTALAEQQEEARKYKAAFDAAQSRDEQINISQQAQIGLTDEGLRSMFTMSNLEKGDPVKAGQYSAQKQLAESRALSEAIKADPSLERTYALGQGVAPSALTPTKPVRTAMQESARSARGLYEEVEYFFTPQPDMDVYNDSIAKGFTQEEAMNAANEAGTLPLNPETFSFIADKRSEFSTLIENLKAFPASATTGEYLEYLDQEVAETGLTMTGAEQSRYQEVATRLGALVGKVNTIAQNGDKRMSDTDRANAQRLLGAEEGITSKSPTKAMAALRSLRLLALKQEVMDLKGLTESNISGDGEVVAQTEEELLAQVAELRNPKKAELAEEGKPESGAAEQPQEDVVIDYTEYFK